MMPNSSSVEKKREDEPRLSYMIARVDQCNHRDTEGGREEGLKQFLDEKSIKPGLQSYKRTG